MRRSLFIVSAFLGAVALQACKQQPSGPNSIDDVPVTETLNVPGLEGPVDIVRDEWGRPHIYATTQNDLFIAVGYVQATDRILQMDLMRRFASGTVAELAGYSRPELVEDDYLLRVLGLRRAAEAIWNQMDPNSDNVVLLTAFTAGVNAYIDELRTGNVQAPLEYALIQYPIAEFPYWSEVDTLAIGRLLAFDQSFFGDLKSQVFDQIQASITTFQGTPREKLHCDIIFRAQAAVDGTITEPDSTRENYNACPADTAVTSTIVSSRQADAVHHMTNRTLRHDLNHMWAPDAGSNNWVVSGAHTANGAPLLANDPHLALSAPSIWYQIHMNTARAGGEIDALGVQLPGVPSLIIGHNGYIGWGITNVIPDVTDNYVEQYSVGTGTGGVDQVMWDDDGAGPNAPALVDLQALDVTLETRTGLTTVDSEVRQVMMIPHRGNATIIPDTYDANTQTALSWRWTGFDVTPEAEMFSEIMRSTTMDDMLAARRLAGVPPTNMVFITQDGDIGWDATALYPVRDDDDGDPYTDPVIAPLPGIGTHEWTGFLDPEVNPRITNPASGWIATSNQDLLGQTLDNDPLNDPIYLAPVFAIGFRGERIAELLDSRIGAGGKLTVEDMQAIQADVRSPVGSRMVPHILLATDGNATYQSQHDLLTGWSDRGFVASANRGPAIENGDAVDDAAATALFNVWLSFFVDRTLADELTAMGYDESAPNSDQFLTRGLLLILERPQDAATYDGTDSVLFDNIDTVGVTETREDIILAALDDATAWLDANAPSDWAWGDLHRLTLESLLGVASFNVPSEGDATYPGGFPRHGDNFTVDPAGWGVRGQDFNYGGGASFRMVISGEKDNFRTWMGFPGGPSGDVRSDFYSNQAESYVANEAPEFWYQEKDVAQNGQERTVFLPE